MIIHSILAITPYETGTCKETEAQIKSLAQRTAAFSIEQFDSWICLLNPRTRLTRAGYSPIHWRNWTLGSRKHSTVITILSLQSPPKALSSGGSFAGTQDTGRGCKCGHGMRSWHSDYLEPVLFSIKTKTLTYIQTAYNSLEQKGAFK